MKLMIAIGLCVSAVLFAGILLEEDFVVHAIAGGGSVPAGNGDTNGDGAYDISDAVYLLSWLFLGGPAPVPILECPPPAEKGLPATGQTKCYDNSGNTIDCAKVDFPGQDGFYQAGCPSAGRFKDNGDGTVTDTCTGLMWQQETADVDGNGSIGDEDRLNWQGILQYCESLDFAGHTDWRLPNVRELQSVVDYGRFCPAIDPVFGAVSDWYWSSSTGAGYPGRAWGVIFSDG